MTSLPVNEQEIVINASRDENKAILYTSDSTWITKMDKLVTKNPELFKVIKEDDWGKFYEFPKKLITIRSGFTQMSEENKQKMAERLKNSKIWEQKSKAQED